ncbi:MAG: hypothetical protein PGN37_01095 [Mycobacterium kyogaense]|uniref:hypothetical protein n=1 Tax=Mycobacterium kyogaense TaxID=2212479 RepID=UPI002FF90F88
MPDNLERSGQIRGEWKLPIAFFDQLSDVENELISAVAGAKNTLLLQASDDAKVGLSHTSAFYDLLSSPKRLEIIEGADHYYAGRETEVVEATLNWFDQIGGTA